MRLLSLLICILLALPPVAAAGSSCTFCHSNRTLMDELGFPGFYFTDEEVWNQSKMLRTGVGGPTCQDCHLGDPGNCTAGGAHLGMPRPIAVSLEGFGPADRYEHLPNLTPQKGRYPLNMLPGDFSLKTVLYHERNPTNYAPNSTLIEATCGKCHREQVEDFLKSPMGNATAQSSYPSFTDPPGPHNCGYWRVNTEKIRAELAVNYSDKQAQVVDRVCQQCHTGCLDCHYQPFLDKGRHYFSRTVPTESCESGGGRGICHAGAEDFRRGAGYNRDLTSLPELPRDAHAAANMTCTDCHQRDGHLFRREVKNCGQCHREAVEGMEESVHRNLSCEACHIQTLGGYQMTIWGPGEYYGVVSPLVKNNYYGVLSEPILIRDQDGIWIPVKALPQAVLNIRGEMSPTGIMFRNLPGVHNRSRDAYAVVGTFKDLPKNNNAVLWVHMDKASHALGPARSCPDCHTTGIQQAASSWIAYGEHVYPPLNRSFTGRYRVVGNATGLYITDIQTTSPISIKDLGHASDFLPWAFGFSWTVRGDFSLPAKDEDACRADRNCTSCHGPGHATVNPAYLRQRPALERIFLGALLALLVALYFLLGGRER
ncbi:MAG: hypothetical protein GXO65_07575 [Euryarchaeota archaeon]|nr:hypothetical protein [Euryarchaeota archaeon]